MKLTKKQQLRNRINNATTFFLSHGGKIKQQTVSKEVNYQLPPMADFVLMDNETFKFVNRC